MKKTSTAPPNEEKTCIVGEFRVLFPVVANVSMTQLQREALPQLKEMINEQDIKVLGKHVFKIVTDARGDRQRRYLQVVFPASTTRSRAEVDERARKVAETVARVVGV